MKCHFHSVLHSVCCKPVPGSADFEHLLGFCTVNLSPTPSVLLQAGRRKGGRAGAKELFRAGELPSSRLLLTFGAHLKTYTDLSHQTDGVG